MYLGYLNTPNLWNEPIHGLSQFQFPETETPFKPLPPLPKLRLGKWVERFVAHQIGANIIAENLQIKKEKHKTIGELDFLFLNNLQPVHLEVVYKFYLYDHTRYHDHYLKHWIGPNRADKLMFKLNKLKSKQLPLLHHRDSEVYLKALGYQANDFKQYVSFKGQLFLPLNLLDKPLKEMNRQCISGFHCHLSDLHLFEKFAFYIPFKLEWLIIPHHRVNWKSFEEVFKTIEDQCAQHRSPMIWLKDPAGNLQKAFVTWW
jgi:hypothetical protein